MNGHIYTSFYVVSLTVLSMAAADVFIINVKPGERSPRSVSIDNTLLTLQELLDDKTNEEKALGIELLTSVQKSDKDEKELFLLGPASSRDLTKTNVADLLRLLDAMDAAKTSNRIPIDVQSRLFGNMYGAQKKPRVVYKKPKRSYGLEPFLNYLISNTVRKSKHKFRDMTRFEPSNIAEDYIDLEELRKQINKHSPDYRDLDNLKFRRSDDYTINAAVTTHSRETEELKGSQEKNGESLFEKFKNKLIYIYQSLMQKFNKNETMSTVAEEIKKKKENYNNRFKLKNNKNLISLDFTGTSISIETGKGPKRYTKQKPKKNRFKLAKRKQKQVSKKEKPFELLLQGNRMTMYPPIDPDSLDERDSESDRRRGMKESKKSLY